ncbi:phosphoglycerate kinase, partial [archaeon]
DTRRKILIGGAMVYTFYKALGHGVGDCFVEEKAIPTAAEIVKRAAESDVILRFATDLTVVPTRAYKVKQAKRVSMTDDSILHDFEYCPRNVSYTDIPEHWTGVDIGPESVVAFSLELEECNTIILSGPMGVVEEPDYSYGTLELLRKMERRTRMGAITIVCGGQTVAAIEEHNMHDFTHVSMGGGAALELLGNRELPGVTILNDEEEGMEIL